MNRLDVGLPARGLPSAAASGLASLRHAIKAADGASFAVVALLSLPYLFLIWRYEFLPMQDLSGHVELSFLHHRLSLKDPLYTPYFQIAPQPWPNSLSTLVLSVFGARLGFENGVKALLSLYVFAWPLSLGVLAKQLGRSPLVALFALPTLLDFSWGFGFFNYLLAKPLVVGAVCVAIWHSLKPSLLRGMLLCIAIGLTFLAHGLAFMIAGVWAGLAVLCFSQGAARLYNLWPLVLSLAYPVRYVLAQRAVSAEVPGGWVWGNWDLMLSTAWHHLGNLNPSDGEEHAYLLAFAAWLLALQFRAPEPSPEHAARLRLGAFFLWLSGAVLLFGYGRGALFMPNVDIVGQRLLVFVWALLMIVPVALPTDFTRHAVSFCLVASIFTHVYATNRQYKQFNEVEMAGYSQLIDMIPPGKGVAMHFYRSTSPFARENAMWHWVKLYGVRKGGGGHSDDTFAWRATSYVNLTDVGRATNMFAVPPMLDFNRLPQFDYQLSHGGTKEAAIAVMSPVADYVASRAEWHLFRLRKPR
jgi:hypothetical protein